LQFGRSQSGGIFVPESLNCDIAPSQFLGPKGPPFERLHPVDHPRGGGFLSRINDRHSQKQIPLLRGQSQELVA
jgi:hypothetical protein